MADSTTSHYSWTKPDPGGSAGTWDTKLNADLDAIDSDLFDVQTAADAAQTAAEAAQDTAEEAKAATLEITPTVVSASGSSPYSVTINLASEASVYTIALTSASNSARDCEITFTNRPATVGRLVYLHFTSSGTAATITMKVQSASKQWALPVNGDDVSASGTQELGDLVIGRQVVFALYIVAGV